MKNDLHKTFGDIFDGDIVAFRQQLLEIPKHQADREASERWVRKLRFLDISKVPNLRHQRCKQRRGKVFLQRRCTIPITRRSDDYGNTRYIAVSWRWPTSDTTCSLDHGKDPLYHYMIQREGAEPRKSDFPDEYLDRVIMFAQEKDITKLWIDKECIFQRKEDKKLYPKDHDHGVQIMDVVYGDSTLSVGLLSTPLTTKSEVRILSSLLSRDIFIDSEDTVAPKLRSSVNIREIQRVILRILSDPRWSRGWIFQEDHLASTKMELLIPCTESIQANLPYDFGSIPGQLQICVAEFRQAVTMFYSANSEDQSSWQNREMLSKAKQYNIWNKRVYKIEASRRARNPDHLWGDENPMYHDGGMKINTKNKYIDVSFYPTMTNSVLDDICNRELECEQDRIAILANALKFSKRLDISSGSPIMKPGKYSLSVALLALILMNGEILANGKFDDLSTAKDLMNHTLRSYLERCLFTFDAPCLQFQQSFIDKFRFRSPKITARGIETEGYLLKLLPRYKPGGRGSRANPIRFNDTDRADLSKLARDSRSQRRPKGRKLNMLAHKAIEIVIWKLEKIWPGSGLAQYLHHHLKLDRNPPVPERRVKSTSVVLDMMAAIAQALQDDDELRLARFADDDDTADPVVIFVAPKLNGWMANDPRSRFIPGNTRVPSIFTSWDNPCGPYGHESLTSLEVAAFDGRGRRIGGDEYDEGCFLRSNSWVNGVCDFRGRKMKEYVFSLPGITCLSAEGRREKTGHKRKRGQGDGSPRIKDARRRT